MGVRGQNHQIDNIEFNVADIARSREFYGDAFGWTFTDYGPEYCEFTDGRLTGGFTPGGPVKTGGPLVILYADDLANAQKRVERRRREDHQASLRVSRRPPFSLHRPRRL